MTKPMTDFNWGKKFTELQEKQGKLGTQKALISRSFIAHAIDQATSKAREEENKFYPIAKATPCPVCGFQVVFENKSLKKDK